MASVSTIGHIDEYCRENKLLSSYLERLDAFFSANDVKDENKSPCTFKSDWGQNVLPSKESRSTDATKGQNA